MPNSSVAAAPHDLQTAGDPPLLPLTPPVVSPEFWGRDMLVSLYTVPELGFPYQGCFFPAVRASLPHRHIFRAKKDLSFTLKSLPSVSDLYGHV